MSFFKEFKDDLSQAVNELVDEGTESADNIVVNTLDDTDDSAKDVKKEEEVSKEDNLKEEKEEKKVSELNRSKEVSEEVTEITQGTRLEGNISSNGSINLNGKIKGDIECNGKLNISGEITGNSNAGEIFTNNAKVSGDVTSEGSIKVGHGTVIIGNVYATSAVLAGAVKGDVDVKGPVILDGTAIIQGNIKSRSVQINNGAVIEGFCSQCYAEVDYDKLFDDTFTKE